MPTVPACGVLEHGFARVRCDACTHEHLLAVSCKARYTDLTQGDVEASRRWLGNARDMRCDHQHFVKREGRLARLT